jgi:hypothetical protein
LEALQQRLREELGADSLLFRRFDVALRQQSARLVDGAMAALRLYPAGPRQRVETIMLDWLFAGAEFARAGEVAVPPPAVVDVYSDTLRPPSTASTWPLT